MTEPSAAPPGPSSPRPIASVETGVADVAVGVTLFRPRSEHVEALVEAFAGRLRHVFVFDNGGVPAETAALLARSPGVRLLSGGGNIGVGAALNRMAEAAAVQGAHYLLLLDQDAEPSMPLVLGLRAAMTRLSAASVPAAMVGPVQRAVAGRKTPRYPSRPGEPSRGALVPVEFMATSGSLLDLAAFSRIGPFRDDYFIDGIDLEWGFRAWATGYGCWVDRDTPMAQCVGSGIIRARWLPMSMPRQPQFRMETYLRNTVYGWRLAHLPLRWKLRQMGYLPLQTALYWADSGYRPAVLGRLLRAVLDGLRGRLGRPAGAP